MGPSTEGFVGMCTESYETDINVKVYDLEFMTGWKLIDEKSFSGGALEFGGDYICPLENPCEK